MTRMYCMKKSIFIQIDKNRGKLKRNNTTHAIQRNSTANEICKTIMNESEMH